MTSTSTFDRWEKDPFFSAAEEVQESADRMESVYRRWIHERKDQPKHALELQLRGELYTALGTAKWQLEEFDRASTSNSEARPAEDGDARIRHSQFVAVIANQILTVENSLRELELEEGGTPLAWVRLDEGERDELALFLSCPPPLPEKPPVAPNGGLREGHKLPPLAPNSGCEGRSDTIGEASVDLSKDTIKNSFHPIELGVKVNREERMHGHRRSASVGTDLGVWKISVSSEGSPRRSLDERSDQPFPKVSSFSGLAMAMKSPSKMKWAKNGFWKWKGVDEHQSSESIPLRTNHSSRGVNACYEKTKSCLTSGSDESYNKQLYGWLGAFQRQLQRSQYQIQYGRPVQVTFWVIVFFLLIVLFLVRAF